MNTFLYKLIRRIRRVLYTIVYDCLFHLPLIKNNRILFISWGGQYFNCNPRAFAEYIRDRKEGFELIAIVKNTKQYRGIAGIRFVKLNSFSHIYYLASSRVVVSNHHLPEYIKRKGQYYIQMWHGIGPKKSEKDSEDSYRPELMRKVIRESKQADLMPSGSKWYSNWIKTSTWHEGKILECGYPRYDCFFNRDIIQERKNLVYKYYGVELDLKTVMYAPSFRSIGEIQESFFNPEPLLEELSNHFGGKWKLLIRLHPLVSNAPLPEMLSSDNNGTVINVTKYPEMQDLLCAADILITDFSSISTDFLKMLKPCFIYAPDFYTYDRGLYFSPQELPCPFALTEEELIKNISNFDYDSYIKAVARYNEFMGMCDDGHASERIFDYMKKYFLN